VLLSFGRISAKPAHVVETFRALQVSASTWKFCDWHAALWVRACLGAVLHKQFVQQLLAVLIFQNDLLYRFIVFEIRK